MIMSTYEWCRQPLVEGMIRACGFVIMQRWDEDWITYTLVRTSDGMSPKQFRGPEGDLAKIRAEVMKYVLEM